MLLNLSITLISLLASSAVSCINIRVKLTYSLASYCRFVLNSHPQQNIEPLYSYIYQNSAIYAKGKQFYLFDLLLFCYFSSCIWGWQFSANGWKEETFDFGFSADHNLCYLALQEHHWQRSHTGFPCCVFRGEVAVYVCGLDHRLCLLK